MKNMIPLVILLGLGLILGIIGKNWGTGLFLGLVFGLITGFIVPHKTTILTHTVYLEAIQDNSTTTGSFFLGSGRINNVWEYTYYVIKDDTYYLEQIIAKGTPIKYTDGTPRIEWTERVRTNDKINKWSLRITLGSGISKKIFYIPKGSIQQNYYLDAN